MKKVLYLLLFISALGLTLSVEASCIRTQSGFMINDGNCEYDDEQQYVFDVLFEKEGYEGLYLDTLDLTRYTDAWGNRPNENQHVLTEALPYMSLDNDYISLIGYGLDLGYYYNNNCYQAIMRDMYDVDSTENPYIYGDFKIIVLDMDYNIVFTSEVYSRDLLPDPEKESFYTFTYDDEGNRMILNHEEMYVHWLEDCNDVYPRHSGDVLIMFIALIGTLGIFFSEPILLAFRKARIGSVILSFIASIGSLGLLSNFPIFSRQEFTFTVLLLLTIHFVKYLIIKYIEGKVSGFENVRSALIKYLILFTIYPMFLYLFVEYITN